MILRRNAHLKAATEGPGGKWLRNRLAYLLHVQEHLAHQTNNTFKSGCLIACQEREAWELGAKTDILIVFL